MFKEKDGQDVGVLGNYVKYIFIWTTGRKPVNMIIDTLASEDYRYISKDSIVLPISKEWNKIALNKHFQSRSGW